MGHHLVDTVHPEFVPGYLYGEQASNWTITRACSEGWSSLLNSTNMLDNVLLYVVVLCYIYKGYDI